MSKLSVDSFLCTSRIFLIQDIRHRFNRLSFKRGPGSTTEEHQIGLSAFPAHMHLTTSYLAIHDVIDLVQGFSAAEKDLMSKVVTVVKLVQVMPVTNAISDSSFSAMSRTKTYLRSSMLQERLNATMVLHVHKESTDALNLQHLSNEFVSESDYCKSKFPVY